MNRPKRKLLIFSKLNLENELLEHIEKFDWEIHSANTQEELIDLSKKHLFKVGIIFSDTLNQVIDSKQINLDSILVSSIDQFEIIKSSRQFNTSRSINWILGVSPECASLINTDLETLKHVAEYCYGCIPLPIDTVNLLIILENAYGMRGSLYPFTNNQCSNNSQFGIIGNSEPMNLLFNQIKKVAREDYSVLIEGETGTGKELVANAIHNNSYRYEFPFVAINCGAFPTELIQAELFGYEKGAFTGANQRKIGRIEQAQGGTLFLDEIGDLPYKQQINLLRFLEDKTITRIGGSEKIATDVRVVAATHVDLKLAVDNKKFREDLYYRLHVLEIKTPALRHRENDICLLANHFFNLYSLNKNYIAIEFDKYSIQLLNHYHWPGNVRQLMNSIRRGLVVSDSRKITPTDLGIEWDCDNHQVQTLEGARSIAERESIIAALRFTNNNMSRAAELLGISRVSLYRLTLKYMIKSNNIEASAQII